MSVELRDRIVLRHRSGEGYQKMSAALKFPKKTVVSIILKCNKFGSTKTSASCPTGQTEQSGKKGRGQGGDQEPDGHSDSALEFLCVDGRNFQKDYHLCSLFGRVARWKPLLSKRHMTARLEFAKGHLKDSQTMRNKILWSNQIVLVTYTWIADVNASVAKCLCF